MKNHGVKKKEDTFIFYDSKGKKAKEM